LTGTLQLSGTEVEQRDRPACDGHRLAQLARSTVIKIGFLVEDNAMAARAFDRD
jgi:hypothetical protein